MKRAAPPVDVGARSRSLPLLLLRHHHHAARAAPGAWHRSNTCPRAFRSLGRTGGGGGGEGRGAGTGGSAPFSSDDDDDDDQASAAAAAAAAANRADADAVAAFLQSCPPRVGVALRAIAADPRGALRQYARDPEIMAALGTVLSRGMAPGRRAAIERLVAATAEEAEAAAAGAAAQQQQQQQQQQQEQEAAAAAAARRRQQEQESRAAPDIPAPGKVVAAMFSDPELARLMADPEVLAALAAARRAVLSGGGDAAARAALEGRGAKVDRAMELLEARLGRFVGAPGGTVDVGGGGG